MLLPTGGLGPTSVPWALPPTCPYSTRTFPLLAVACDWPVFFIPVLAVRPQNLSVPLPCHCQAANAACLVSEASQSNLSTTLMATSVSPHRSER